MNTVTLFGSHYRPPRTDSASDGSEPAPPPSPPGSAEAGSRCRDPAGQRVLGRLAHWPGGAGEQGTDAPLPGDAAAAPINERDGHIERGIQGPDQAAGVVAPVERSWCSVQATISAAATRGAWINAAIPGKSMLGWPPWSASRGRPSLSASRRVASGRSQGDGCSCTLRPGCARERGVRSRARRTGVDPVGNAARGRPTVAGDGGASGL